MIDNEVTMVRGCELHFAEGGTGKPVLVLHGGGGTATVAEIAQQFETAHHVIMPTHPGWNGTARPAWLDSVDELALLYLRFLAQRGMRDVLVIGSSLGGWLAAQMASRDIGGLVGRIVLIDAVGVAFPEYPMADFFSLTPRGIAEHAYHDPNRFFVDPSTLPPERVALQRGNIATLKALAADPCMHDPNLLGRLHQVQIPALVIWGESDRIATPAYGAAYAKALGNARFELVPKAGHLPQLEQPEATFALIDGFAAPDAMDRI
jgi:pimeloyl-ACP methyl ester carboxylesterase